MRRWAVATLTAVAAMAAMPAGGCRDGRDAARGDPRPTVAVSIPPQAWLVGRIAGGHVRVITLLSPGDDPHTYQPSDAQVTGVMRARVYLRIGVPFEAGKWAKAIESSGRVKVVDVQQGITLRTIEAHEHDDHGHLASGQPAPDPHVWLSPKLLKVQARNVGRALAEADPDHAADYRTNLAELEAELDRLDGELAGILRPVRGRAFIVFHPAWGYFADTYGLHQVAIEVEGKEPADRELTELKEQAERIGARVVFVQLQISGRSADAVARAIGGRTERLDPLAEDVPANLRSAARAIAAALGVEGGP